MAFSNEFGFPSEEPPYCAISNPWMTSKGFQQRPHRASTSEHAGRMRYFRPLPNWGFAWRVSVRPGQVQSCRGCTGSAPVRCCATSGPVWEGCRPPYYHTLRAQTPLLRIRSPGLDFPPHLASVVGHTLSSARTSAMLITSFSSPQVGLWPARCPDPCQGCAFLHVLATFEPKSLRIYPCSLYHFHPWDSSL